MVAKVEWIVQIEDEFMEAIKNLKEEASEGETHKLYWINAYELAQHFINERYNFYLNHYNKDLGKMDNFVYQNLISELRVFANVSYSIVASVYEKDETKLNTTKKALNSIVNELEECEIEV